MKNNLLIISNNLENSINEIDERFSYFIDIMHMSRSISGRGKSFFLYLNENINPITLGEIIQIINSNNEKYGLFFNHDIIKTNLSVEDKDIFWHFADMHSEKDTDFLINFITYS